MSDSTEQSAGYQEPKAVLLAYGLDVLLTEQDDPGLWAAALRQHWPAADDPRCAEQILRFGIGRRIREGEDLSDPTLSLHAGSRGMVEIEEWCFERVDPGRLRVTRCQPQTAASPLWDMMPMADKIRGILSGSPPPVSPPLCLSRLDVTRPSQNVDEAVVHSGTIAGPLAGSGAAVLWRRRDDGSWAETDEVVVRWIS
jgi:hypothetical protein